ncbi:MAG: C1 family peptidase [Peptococcales bacterium]
MSIDYRQIPLHAIPSPYDPRNYTVSMFSPVLMDLPNEYISPYIPEVQDQFLTSMCVAYTLASLKEMQELKERKIRTRYSPGFIYGNRLDTDHQGEGMHVHQGLHKLLKDGVCAFTDYQTRGSYSACKNGLRNKPHLYELAKPQVIKSYVRINMKNNDEIKTAIYKWDGVPIVVAINDSFYRANGNKGLVPDVEQNDIVRGYHAMLAVGWKKISGRYYWIVVNSWGKSWGDKGYCYIPFNYSAIIEGWSVVDDVIDEAEYIKMLIPMTMISDRTMLGFRDVYAALGAQIEWNQATQTARAIIPPSNKTITIETKLGSNVMKILRT